MTSTDVILLTSKIFSLALLMQCLEFIFISKNKSFLKIWSLKNIKTTLFDGLPIPNRWIIFLFSEKTFQRFLYVYLVSILISLAIYHPFLILGLALMHLFICIRFRGNFNGGSDMMTFVVATGLIIGGPFGLVYIAIHCCYSYFKAGLVKVIQPVWRSGQSLSSFLQISLYPDVKSLGELLKPKKNLTLILSWLTLIFEISIPIVFIFPELTVFYFFGAVLFHFMICITFGLNRFFWIWLAAWPALFFSVNFIKSWHL